ncbi:TonB-dependent receptor plug domain-containing protein [Sphingomonas sp. S-NIH.Pt15_0812]|uniref:TonB-dependent receptor plug domain-containing protein n=1 Tax=Sphingomonas sp. S-NIH.Pt15_0812 TaxID=1920129 RepID=UPI0019D0220A|nr:TonB-dependent receptor plug domain-containing protein [Sphingomonas sp. S-NIH.Pt15_0812]
MTTPRALNQQRTADNTVTIVSADAIGRFPDPNIAEALQRAPGVGIERDQGEGRYINVRGAQRMVGHLGRRHPDPLGRSNDARGRPGHAALRHRRQPEWPPPGSPG